jgi:hypothetical protein
MKSNRLKTNNPTDIPSGFKGFCIMNLKSPLRLKTEINVIEIATEKNLDNS